jgi:hypothetical protein
MEQKMLKALNGTWRTWETGYPIRFITITDGDIAKRQRDRTRKQYRPRSKLYRKRGRPKLVVNNCS